MTSNENAETNAEINKAEFSENQGETQKVSGITSSSEDRSDDPEDRFDGQEDHSDGQEHHSDGHDDSSVFNAAPSGPSGPEEEKVTFQGLVNSLLDGEEFQSSSAGALENLKALLTPGRVTASLKKSLDALDGRRVSREQVEKAAAPILANLCEKIGDDFIRARVASEMAMAFPKGITSEESLASEMARTLDKLARADEAFLDSMVKGLVTTIAGGIEVDSKGVEDTRRADGEIKHLRNEVDRLRALANERVEMIERLKKDYDNLRKRSAERETEIQRNAAEKMASDMLPALDTFDRAIAACSGADEAIKAYLAGFTAIRSQFGEVLSKNGVTMMDCVGKPFDAELHDAVFHKPEAEIEDGTIVEVAEAGYTINDKVLRHARVIVAKRID